MVSLHLRDFPFSVDLVAGSLKVTESRIGPSMTMVAVNLARMQSPATLFEAAPRRSVVVISPHSLSDKEIVFTPLNNYNYARP